VGPRIQPWLVCRLSPSAFPPEISLQELPRRVQGSPCRLLEQVPGLDRRHPAKHRSPKVAGGPLEVLEAPLAEGPQISDPCPTGLRLGGRSPGGLRPALQRRHPGCEPGDIMRPPDCSCRTPPMGAFEKRLPLEHLLRKTPLMGSPSTNSSPGSHGLAGPRMWRKSPGCFHAGSPGMNVRGSGCRPRGMPYDTHCAVESCESGSRSF
jgi:hypothetical protein